MSVRARLFRADGQESAARTGKTVGARAGATGRVVAALRVRRVAHELEAAASAFDHDRETVDATGPSRRRQTAAFCGGPSRVCPTDVDG